MAKANNPCGSIDEFLDQNEKDPNNSVLMSELLETIKSVRELETQPATVGLFKIQSEEISSMKVSENLSKVAAGTEDSEIVLWDLDMTNDLQYFSSRIYKHWKQASAHRNNSSVDFKLINDEQSSDKADEMADQVEPFILRGHSKPIYDLSFMSNTDLLLSASGDTSVRAWDTKSTCCLAVYHGHAHAIWSIDSTRRGHMVSGDCQGMVLVWDVKHTVPLRLIPAHQLDINQVRFHPTYKYFATASSDKIITLWDVNQARPVRNFKGHTAAVNTISFSPCGRYLASGSADGSIRIWSVKDGSLINELVDHLDNIRSVAFSKSGTSVASCGTHTPTLHCWREPTCKSNSSSKTTYQLDRSAMDKQDQPKTSLIDLVYLNKSTDILLALGKQCQ